jgi:hypothetical protein
MLRNQGIFASGFVLVGEGARRPGYYYAPDHQGRRVASGHRREATVGSHEVDGGSDAPDGRETPADSEESVGTTRT